MITRGYYVFNLVVNALIALGLGAIIVLILTILNHGGWFALISGLIGGLIYYARVLPKILFGLRSEEHRFRSQMESGYEIKSKETGQAAVVGAYKCILLCSLFAVGIGFGLYYLPSQHLDFVLMSAILGLCLCACLLAIGLSILVILIIHRQQVY